MSSYKTDEAFAIVPLWVADSTISDRAVRLYAMLSGMRDYGTDMTTVGRKLLARELRCSDDSLDRAKAELEKIGAITVERGRSDDGQIARNVYTIHRVNPASRTDAVRTPAEPPVPAGKRHGSPSKDEKSSSTTGKAPQSVDGKRVTVEEHDLADAVLAAFNEISGKRFGGKEWRRAIIMRIREHRDLTAADHRSLIESQMAHPWWKDDPTPAVIYGKGNVFDRALNGVRGGDDNSRDEQDDPYARGAERADG